MSDEVKTCKDCKYFIAGGFVPNFVTGVIGDTWSGKTQRG